jgi:hypothetical protein
MTGVLNEDRYKIPSVRPRIRNLTDKSCRQNQNIYFIELNTTGILCLIFFFFRKSCR